MKPDTAMPDHLHGHVCRYISNPAARDQVLDCIDAALLDAHQRGRLEGMEEARFAVALERLEEPSDSEGDQAYQSAIDDCERAIRAKMEEQP